MVLYYISSNLSTLFLKLIKLVGRFFNLSISNISASDFKLIKSAFLAKDDVSNPVEILTLFLLHNLKNLILFSLLL